MNFLLDKLFIIPCHKPILNLKYDTEENVVKIPVHDYPEDLS
ncbi:MAG TPA: hypothetical protein VMY43_01905 [Methanothrix sp.]|nr:hypothetical protein [Methanothrix sp.]